MTPQHRIFVFVSKSVSYHSTSRHKMILLSEKGDEIMMPRILNFAWSPRAPAQSLQRDTPPVKIKYLQWSLVECSRFRTDDNTGRMDDGWRDGTAHHPHCMLLLPHMLPKPNIDLVQYEEVSAQYISCWVSSDTLSVLRPRRFFCSHRHK